jgi:hypothetical protein
MRNKWIKCLGTKDYVAELGPAIAQGLVVWSEMFQVWTVTEKGKPWLRS